MLEELPLYPGDAKVLVRPAGSRRVVAHRTAHGGAFRMGLAPGRYVVSVSVPASCWRGEAKPLRIKPDAFAALALEVQNDCLTP